MGSLHGGHVSLIKKSKKMCEKTVVSIFVNPKQFNNKKDFIKYLETLIQMLKFYQSTKLIIYYYQVFRICIQIISTQNKNLKRKIL